MKKLFASVPPFDGVHVFTPHADVPDDSALRLVVLPPEQSFMKDDPRQATDAVLEHLRMHGGQPRHRANRLIFLAADHAVLNRLRDATRVALAWASIVEDVDEGRLNIDQIQRKQAEKESQAANAVLPRAARECFKWLLCPVQDDPTATRPTVEVVPAEHDQRRRAGRAGAGLPRERAGHRDVVADPPASEAEGALLEGRASRRSGRWRSGKTRYAICTCRG